MALDGMWTQASSNNTEFNKLFVWYSADDDLAREVFHLLCGKELQIHLGERGFGCGIT